ncbi:MAG: hypothetical protein Q4G61_08690, partial [Tissierellia bacterium]|nr:hypothetical protein [Tissierellia bacterium]
MSATDFRNWLDATIEIIPSIHDGIVAVHFNLYEDTEDKWSVECIGTSSFDPDDEDWACDEVFTSRESPYQWQESTTWDQILEEKIHQLKDYLKTGRSA